jgi:hypothetical protein
LAGVGGRSSDQKALTSRWPAIERNKAVVVTPPNAKPLWYLQRLSPRLAGQVAQVLARKVNRELVEPRT